MIQATKSSSPLVLTELYVLYIFELFVRKIKNDALFGNIK